MSVRGPSAAAGAVAVALLGGCCVEVGDASDKPRGDLARFHGTWIDTRPNGPHDRVTLTIREDSTASCEMVLSDGAIVAENGRWMELFPSPGYVWVSLFPGDGDRPQTIMWVEFIGEGQDEVLMGCMDSPADGSGPRTWLVLERATGRTPEP